MRHCLHRTLMIFDYEATFAHGINDLLLFAQDFNDLQLFAQDIPDEVFDLYCWIHSTYTIPRALRSLYILVISSATGTEGKTYRQVTTSFFQHPPNIDKDNPKCYAMNIVRTSFPS